MHWPSITVVTPTIAPRTADRKLYRACESVENQTYQGDVIHEIVVDEHRQGAGPTRQRGLDAVTTPWVAFLDDDDEFLPQHLETLMTAALENDADYVYSWFIVEGGSDPFPMHFGKPFDPQDPVQTTVTTLVKTDLAKAAGFVPPFEHKRPTVGGFIAPPDGNRGGEDWIFTLRCVDLGAHILHVPERTWRWYHHGQNTSGLPDRW